MSEDYGVIRQAIPGDAKAFGSIFARMRDEMAYLPRIPDFQNDGARRLYERHGCRLVELTDGFGSEEHEPDALYEWAP